MQVCSIKRLFFSFLASLLMKATAAQGQTSFFVQESVVKKPVLPGLSALTLPIAAFRPASVPSPVFHPQNIRPDFYARYMAWTCRQELKLQQAIQLPLYLRLGNLDQVNKLEGKYRAPVAW